MQLRNAYDCEKHILTLVQRLQAESAVTSCHVDGPEWVEHGTKLRLLIFGSIWHEHFFADFFPSLQINADEYAENNDDDNDDDVTIIMRMT